jgi:glycosyltransferase involved in cell wall biosynthesis
MYKYPNQGQSPPVSVIITVLNEQDTILDLLKALANQTYPAKEIIIVDGGSQDKTFDLLKKFSQSHPSLNLKLKIKPGYNISQGRNWGIKQAKNELIAITDAGCVPQKDWLEELVYTYLETNKPVVAGYYYGLAQTPFEQAVVPYVLVMPDQIQPHLFLPASRSMLMEKKVWKKVGGFPERLQVSEDFSLAHKLKKLSIPIAFSQEAKVGWKPRKSLQQFIKMIFNFAQGDILAGIIRRRVVLLFARYLIGFGLVLFLFTSINFWVGLGIILALILTYLGWAIFKNIRYTKNGWYWLPILQISSDLAVMMGTVSGLLKLVKEKTK